MDKAAVVEVDADVRVTLLARGTEEHKITAALLVTRHLDAADELRDRRRRQPPQTRPYGAGRTILGVLTRRFPCESFASCRDSA